MKNNSQLYKGLATVKYLPNTIKEKLDLQLQPMVERIVQDYGNGIISLEMMTDQIMEAVRSSVSLPNTVFYDQPCMFTVKPDEDELASPDSENACQAGLYWNGVWQGSCNGLNPENGITDGNGKPVEYSFLIIRGDVHVFTISEITPEDIDCGDHYVLDTDDAWLEYMKECRNLAEENFFNQYIQLMELKADMTKHIDQSLVNLVRANKRVLRKTGYWKGLMSLAGRF